MKENKEKVELIKSTLIDLTGFVPIGTYIFRDHSFIQSVCG